MFLTDFRQVAKGLRWSSGRFATSHQYAAWYDNQENSVWTGFKWPDGLSDGVRSHFYVYLNWFRGVSDFWGLALSSDEAHFSPELVNFSEVLNELAVFESRDGYMVVRRGPGGLRAVNPVHWVPVLADSDGDEYLGHVVGYPWRSLDDGNSDPKDYAAPNMIDLHLVPDGGGGSIRERRRFDGNVLGDLISRESSPIESVHVQGDGVSDYSILKNAVREFSVRMSLASRVLNRHSNPHLQGPLTAIKYRPDGTRYVDIPPGGGYLPRDDEQPEYSYLTWDAPMDAHQAHVSRIVDWMHWVTGIPKPRGEDGGGLGDMSGSAMETEMFRAVARIKRSRRRVAALLEESGFSVTWQLDPFETKASRSASLRELVGGGIISGNQAAEILSYEPDGTPVPAPGVVSTGGRDSRDRT